MQKSIKSVLAFARKRWFFLLLVAAELVFLGVRFATDCQTGQAVTLDRSWFSPYYGKTAVVDEGILFSGSDETADAEQTFCVTDTFDLPAGSYRVVVTYRNVDCTTTYNFGRLQSTDVPGLSWDAVQLTPSFLQTEGSMLLTSGCFGEAGLYMRFTAAAGSEEGSSSLIEKVQLLPTHAWAYSHLFGMLALFLLLDLALLMFRGVLPNPWPTPKKACSALILVAIVLLACQPMGLTYTLLTHDLTVHLNRIDLLAQTLMQGQFPARLYPNVGYGKGYPFGIMYPDLFLYPFAILRILGFTLQTAYRCYVLCITALTALITRYCLRRMFGSETVALTGAALYVLCYYRLTNVFIRGAVGEYTAMAFLPLVIYGLWRIYTQPKDGKKAAPWCWVPLALGYTGLLQSHLLSTLMAAFLTALFCLILLRRTFTRPVLAGLCKAVGGALLWNIWYLVPCLQYMQAQVCLISTKMTGSWKFARGAVFLMQLFSISGPAGGASWPLSEGFAGDMPLTVGTVLGLGMLLMLVVLVQPALRKRYPQMVAAGGISLGLGAFSLYLSSTLFPWTELGEMMPQVIAKFETLQFPWRFLSTASALLVVACCCALRLLPDLISLPATFETLTGIVSRCARMGLAAVLLLMTVLPGAELMYSICAVSPIHYYLSNASIQGQLTQVSNGEYLPAEIRNFTDLDELTDLSNGILWDIVDPTVPEDVTLTDFSRGVLSCTFTAQNTLDSARTIRLPLFYYPGYSVTAGDTAVAVTQDTGFVAAVLPAGWSGSVTIGWTPRFYWHLFDLLSLAGVIATVVLYRRRPQHRAPTAN